MYILGISGQERSAAAALIRDGKVVAAVAEENLARISRVGITDAGGLPHRAIDFCLERAAITLDKIDYVAYYLDPYKLFQRETLFYSSHRMNPSYASIDQLLPTYMADSLNGLNQRLRTRRLLESRLPTNSEFLFVDHQMAHGAGAFYTSGFERAAVISAGNRGDMTTTALMSSEGRGLIAHSHASFPHSIGMVYSAVTAALGFGADGEWHKTMWLSHTGAPRFAELFADVIGIDSAGLPEVNLAYFEMSCRGELSLSRLFFEVAGFAPRKKDEHIRPIDRDLACSLQARVEDLLCEIAVRHREETGHENLCLAGGVSLNSLANAAVERRAGYKRIFVQPGADNAGSSVGAALYVWHDVLKNHQQRYRMEDAFLGPQFDDEQVKFVLENCRLNYQYFPAEDKLIAEVAQLIFKGNIVGWFRGAMEFGPRTLGARSILASPLNEVMRDNLNHYIKHREAFRPFSAAVPEERADEFFEPSMLSPFIQSVSRVKDAVRTLIPAAVFGDGLVRVHTVSRKTNKPLWKLLLRFAELSGLPVLLNTSFNLFGEPVVSTPREGVRGFYCAGIDCLAIGSFLVKK